MGFCFDGCSCNAQVLSVVGLLQDETDPMVSVMKVNPSPSLPPLFCDLEHPLENSRAVPLESHVACGSLWVPDSVLHALGDDADDKITALADA